MTGYRMHMEDAHCALVSPLARLLSNRRRRSSVVAAPAALALSPWRPSRARVPELRGLAGIMDYAACSVPVAVHWMRDSAEAEATASGPKEDTPRHLCLSCSRGH